MHALFLARRVAAVCGGAALLLASTAALADGLGGEYLVADRWRLAHPELSPTTNPSFIIERNYPCLRYSGTRLLSTFSMHEVGLSVPLGFHQAVGLTWLYQGAGEYDQTVFDAGSPTDSTVGTVVDRNNSFLLTYALSPWRRLTIGLSAHVLYRHFADEQQAGVGLDAGLSWEPTLPVWMGRHTLGAALQNALAPAVGDGLTRSLNLTWHGSWFEERMDAGVQARLMDIGYDGGGDAVPWSLSGRLGFTLLRMFKMAGVAGVDAQGLDFYGGLAGLNVPSANRGRDFEVQCQLVRLAGDVTSISFHALVEVGRHREERSARKTAERLNIAPSTHYNTALTLFYAGKYWEALLALGSLRADFPDFYKADWVDYHEALCMERLGMDGAARRAFERTRRENPRSPVVPLLDLGVMRTAYRQGDPMALRQCFGAIYESDVADSIKAEAAYLWGQSNIRGERWSDARELLERVPAGHPLYVYAQYSAAVANYDQGQIAPALHNLLNVLGVPPVTREQQEIANKAALQLGQLYLEDLKSEELSLAKAVSALRRVPSGSASYAEAQIALAWAALRAGNWPDCLDVGTALLHSDANPLLRAEGGLIAGYAHYKANEFPAAADLLQRAADLVDQLAQKPRMPPHLDGPVYAGLDSVAALAVRLAPMKGSPQMAAMLDSLHTEQERLSRQLGAWRRDFDAFGHHTVFMYRFEDLQTDVDFLLARALDAQARQKGAGAVVKTLDKQQKIDDQIKALQNQIKQLKK
jgi:tetratricopeptide (TPR) repeat protein